MLNRVMTKDNIALAALLQTKEACWENGIPPDHKVHITRDLDNIAEKHIIFLVTGGWSAHPGVFCPHSLGPGVL